jgi:ribosome-associated translation inhibitor RaiA
MRAQLTFQGMKASGELRQDVEDRVAWLEQFYPQMIGCRVRLAVPHRHRGHGRHLHVHIEMSVPGGEPIVIDHVPSLELAEEHRYAHVAIREAFDAARRRLQDFARAQRGDVKAHA